MTAPLLTIPTSMIAAGVTMTMTRAVGESMGMFSFEEQFFKWPGERWSMEFSYPDLQDADIAEEWIAFFLKLEGKYGRFNAGDPAYSAIRGIGGGTPLVDGGSQAGNELNIKGAPINTVGWLKRGAYIQLSSGASARLHKLTANADTDGAGKVTLEIVPALRISPADNAPITISSPVGIFRLTENGFSWNRAPGGIYRFNASAVEVL